MRQQQRVELVEKAIREKPWTEQVVADLIKATGSSRASVYRDRAVVLKKLAQEEAEGMEERRAAFLLDLRRVREEARADRAYSPAARLLAMESQVLGLDRVPLPDVSDEPGPVDTSLEAVLTETRRMRRQAQAGHTYTAADRLLEREHAIVESIRQRDEAARDRDLVDLSEEEKVAMVGDLLRGLPDDLRKKVLAGLL